MALTLSSLGVVCYPATEMGQCCEVHVRSVGKATPCTLLSRLQVQEAPMEQLWQELLTSHLPALAEAHPCRVPGTSVDLNTPRKPD
jgi:hypothetical protein